jgi:hypothetical protein
MFMDLSIVHLDQAVAASCETSIVRGHQQGSAFGSNQLEQEIEDHFARLLIE